MPAWIGQRVPGQYASGTYSNKPLPTAGDYYARRRREEAVRTSARAAPAAAPAGAPAAASTPYGGLLEAWEQSTAEQRERNIARLEELRGGYGELTEETLGEIATVGTQERRDIARQGRELQAGGLQQLVSTGLYGTGVAQSVRRRAAEFESDAGARLAERLATLRSGVKERLGTGWLGALERVEEPYPDYGLFAQLIGQLGYGEAPVYYGGGGGGGGGRYALSGGATMAEQRKKAAAAGGGPTAAAPATRPMEYAPRAISAYGGDVAPTGGPPRAGQQAGTITVGGVTYGTPPTNRRAAAELGSIFDEIEGVWRPGVNYGGF